MLAPTLDIVTIQVLRRLGCTVSCTPQRLVLNLESDAFLRRSTEIVKAQLEVTRLEVWTGEMVTGPGTMFQIERVDTAVVQNHPPDSRTQLTPRHQYIVHSWIPL
jgi:hypothetical protein